MISKQHGSSTLLEPLRSNVDNARLLTLALCLSLTCVDTSTCWDVTLDMVKAVSEGT